MTTLSSSPSAHLRKKRNFKALQLPTGAQGANAPASTDPVATRLAPAPEGGVKRRPPPLDDSTMDSGGGVGFLSAAPESAMATTSARANMRATISSTLANFQEKRKAFDLKNDELRNIEELGSGNGGSVMKVEHVASGTIMAKKV
jgi:mitogen-activated protein kinase kinase